MFKNKLLIALFSLFVFGFSSANYAATETTTQYVKSSAITADVKAKLLADADVKSLHITVKTVKDRVVLTGYVNTDAQKEKAASIASTAEGVKSVTNRLKVKPKKD
ncbi:MAG: BON domain-containing protein [Gammaproteobacteria bacterium]|nr:BON domain-containing protein [Gammaproteobacteria bacterium]